MLVILGAAVLGGVIGLLTGGRLKNLAEFHFRWWPLALLGLAMQLIPVSLNSQRGHLLGVGLLVGSYLVLIVFVLLNLEYRGLWIMAVGFVLNIAVITINGGMPVSNSALRTANGSGYRATLTDLREHGGAKHHLRRPDDDFTAISDVIPVGGPVHQVFSPGDMVALAGLAWVLAEATREPRAITRSPS
jgi:hypothetical protein